MSKIRGSFREFNIVHDTDILIRSSYKEKFEQENTGIILTIAPSVVEDRPTSGTVIQIGNSISEFKVGDIVHFTKTSGCDLYFEEESKDWFILLSIDSILGFESKY